MYWPGIATVDKHLEQVGLGGAQHLGDLEAVDQRRLAAGAVE